MTPKDKAQELVEKFHYQICNDCGLSESDSTEFAAKQCAIIAVDEMVNSWKQYTGMYEQEYFDGETKFWQQVKEEINKL